MVRSAIVARADKRDAAGTLPLFLRLSHKNSVSYVTLSLRVKERDWNPARSEIRKSHAEHHNLNAYLQDALASVESVVAEMLSAGLQVSLSAVKPLVLHRLRGDSLQTPPPAACFLAYADSVVEDFRRRGQVGTAKAYGSVMAKLRSFVLDQYGASSLAFDEITVTLLRNFQTYLIEVKKNRTNTVHKALSTTRSLLFQAIREGHFPQEKNPFFHLKMRQERVRKDKLSIGDIAALEALDLQAGSVLWHVRNWFLFAFYAGGVRFSDVAMLRWEHLKRQRLEDGREIVRLIYRMKKTRESAGTLLVPQALAILTHYREREEARRRAECLLFEGRVFPILDGYDVSTPTALLNSLSTRNVLANKYLKKLQAMAGIETHLSFHLARHSLADYLRKQGWSVYDISKVLAHSSIAVTEQYLKGFDQEDLDDKMSTLF
jgi:site-specific recombinase XerD